MSSHSTNPDPGPRSTNQLPEPRIVRNLRLELTRRLAEVEDERQRLIRARLDADVEVGRLRYENGLLTEALADVKKQLAATELVAGRYHHLAERVRSFQPRLLTERVR